MSGFVAIVGPPGSPVEEPRLDAMTKAMTFRGADGLSTWTGDGVGLGCALHRTAHAAPTSGQPVALGDHLRIVGQIRLDDRDALATGLGEGGASDLELVLAAYRRGGAEALAALRGEFAFALWDGRARLLLCARDPFGVRPLYHARVGDCWMVGNTLESLRLHPGLSSRLDDLSIAEFLLFGRPWSFERTAFADVKRVPPGHHLMVEDGRSRLHRYWSLPPAIPEPPRGRDEIVPRLVEHLERAARERVSGDDAVVFMSGGLDSTTVAAMAKRALDRDSVPHSLLACTMVLDEALPRVPWRPMPSEEESLHARAVADHLGIGHRVLEFSDAPLYERWREGRDLPPEPIDLPQLGPLVDAARDLARERGVGLTGEGGDACFRPPMGEGRRPGPLGWLRAVWRFTRTRGHLPTLSLRQRLGRRMGRPDVEPAFPPFFEPDLVRRLDLQDRWRAWLDAMPGRTVGQGVPRDPEPRPEARCDLGSPWWPSTFQAWDPEVLRAPLEFRHPFFDTRHVEFILSLDAVPWFWEKLLLREVAREALPDAVWRRPKAVDRVTVRHRLVLKEGPGAMRVNEQSLLRLTPYLRIPVLRRLLEAPERLLSNEIRLITRPVTLGWWLKHVGDRATAVGAGEM